MNNKGWVKLHRQFLEWEWYSDTNCVRVFLHCLLKANHKDKKWQGETIERGEFLTGLSIFAHEVSLSVQEVRTAFKKLESTGEINKQSTSKGTRIIVCKYDTYQGKDDAEQQANNKQTTNQQQTSNKRTTTTKNEKNDKNEENMESKIPELSEVVEYFVQNGYSSEAGKKAFDYYQASIEGTRRKMWRDSKGNPIKNWKQKMRSVWFKEENKPTFTPHYYKRL